MVSYERTAICSAESYFCTDTVLSFRATFFKSVQLKIIIQLAVPASKIFVDGYAEFPGNRGRFSTRLSLSPCEIYGGTLESLHSYVLRGEFVALNTRYFFPNCP